jgi:uncharacterized protein YndB with AHSA1/START domain
VESTASSVAPAAAGTGVSVMVERPPEAVFAAVTDVAHHTDWARGPEEITGISDDPVRLGTTWQQVGKLLGRKIVNRMQVNAYEENRKFGYASDKPFPVQLLYTLAPVPGGTELRVHASGEPANVFGKVAMPLLARSLERQMEADLCTLKALLEDQAQVQT